MVYIPKTDGKRRPLGIPVVEDKLLPLYHDPPDYGSWITGPRPPCQMRYRRRPIPLSGGL